MRSEEEASPRKNAMAQKTWEQLCAICAGITFAQGRIVDPEVGGSNPPNCTTTLQPLRTPSDYAPTLAHCADISRLWLFSRARRRLPKQGNLRISGARLRLRQGDLHFGREVEGRGFCRRGVTSNSALSASGFPCLTGKKQGKSRLEDAVSRGRNALKLAILLAYMNFGRSRDRQRESSQARIPKVQEHPNRISCAHHNRAHTTERRFETCCP